MNLDFLIFLSLVIIVLSLIATPILLIIQNEWERRNGKPTIGLAIFSIIIGVFFLVMAAVLIFALLFMDTPRIIKLLILLSLFIGGGIATIKKGIKVYKSAVANEEKPEAK